MMAQLVCCECALHLVYCMRHTASGRLCAADCVPQTVCRRLCAADCERRTAAIKAHSAAPMEQWSASGPIGLVLFGFVVALARVKVAPQWSKWEKVGLRLAKNAAKARLGRPRSRLPAARLPASFVLGRAPPRSWLRAGPARPPASARGRQFESAYLGPGISLIRLGPM